jgi:hypothetical protein
MKIKEVLLGIIIAVVLLMFLVFGSKLVYDSPEYEDYCDYSRINVSENNGYYQECSEGYDSARENYSKKMFILSLIVGVIVIVGSAVFININSVSGGLMFGSLMFVIYGTGSYWQYMNDWVRFVILGLALGVLIYVGYWLSSRESKGKNKKSKRKK